MIKKGILLFVLLFLQSCGFTLEQEAYNFDNFRDTPLWELAQAARADDAGRVKLILKDKNLKIDLKDPIYHQTLLALVIQNKKRSAFLELLKAGANPNELIGNPEDATPFIYAIWNVENCDLFYVETMLRHRANPNLEIKNPKPQNYFQNSFPLLVSIGITDSNGNECLNLIKLLVDNGADINVCYQPTKFDICENVITYSLVLDRMETLKYFVIEKRMPIPDTVFISGFEESDQKAQGLREMLTSKEYQYEDFERDGIKVNRYKIRKTRDEILEYLDKNNK